MLIKLTLSYIFSKLICHPSGPDVQLLCLKFQTKLASFYWIIAICFGGHFLLGYSVECRLPLIHCFLGQPSEQATESMYELTNWKTPSSFTLVSSRNTNIIDITRIRIMQKQKFVNKSNAAHSSTNCETILCGIWYPCYPKRLKVSFWQWRVISWQCPRFLSTSPYAWLLIIPSSNNNFVHM